MRSEQQKSEGREQNAVSILQRVAREEADRADTIADILRESEPDAVWQAEEQAAALRAAAARVG